jgi:amino acid adenylation domain-containing protein
MPPLLQELVTAQAEVAADRTAVVLDAERLTYAQLDALSNQIARLLKEAGLRRGDRVALCMRKCPTAIAALLGIYKADGIYVPLDPLSPAPRLVKMLESCGTRWILAGGVDRALVDALCGGERAGRMSLGWLESQAPGGSGAPAFTLDDVVRCSDQPLRYDNSPGDPAHILFTSGSTGTPKGVVITHANVLRFVEWATGYFEMEASDRVSAHPPLHFDLSFFDIFGTLAAGAELHLVPPELNLLPNRLADLIRRSALTQWFSVPAVLTYMAQRDVVRHGDFPRLRRVLWCGEVLPTPTLIYWMTRLPHVQFTNLYGPTEATIASSFHTVAGCPEDPQASIPIGVPCGGEELLVLDEAMRPLSAGEVGTLYIGGAGLSPGYWRDRERTDAVFVRHPERPLERLYNTGDLARTGEDGLVYFIGRADTQIKSRGYRIELGEIEAAVNAVTGVQEGAVVALPSAGFEGSAICCAYVPASAGITPIVLRRELSRLLPSYMLPARWISLDQFPRNANGKIDRPRLKQAFEAHAAQAC